MNKNFALLTEVTRMRRSAIHFSIPVVCALLGVTLIGASGKADEAESLPELAMAVATPPALAPTTRPSIEMLITSAPVKIQATMVKPVVIGPKVIMMEVTAYCPCKKCCGPKAQGITASGKRVNFNGGLFVAADKNVFDFHTKLKIPGYANDTAVPVLDRGGAIKGNKLDVFFPSHQQARKWGRQVIPVTVLE